MSIDLTTCIGCNACVVACQVENNVPVVGREQVSLGHEMHWLRVDRVVAREADDAGLAFRPVPCMHCENAPCEPACPVGATLHDAEGLNVMVYRRCTGARSCAAECPYQVRRFNVHDFTRDVPELLRLTANPNVTVRGGGVMEKCTYCVQRINRGKSDAKLAGRALADGDVRTACQQACPTRAIEFGDLRDPRSAVARLEALDRSHTLLAELGTRPRTTYLARIRNRNAEVG